MRARWRSGAGSVTRPARFARRCLRRTGSFPILLRRTPGGYACGARFAGLRNHIEAAICHCAMPPPSRFPVMVHQANDRHLDGCQCCFGPAHRGHVRRALQMPRVKIERRQCMGFSKCEIKPATSPCRFPPPRGVSSLDLDRRRKPRGPFFCRRIWTADAWSGRTQAHQPVSPRRRSIHAIRSGGPP